MTPAEEKRYRAYVRQFRSHVALAARDPEFYRMLVKVGGSEVGGSGELSGWHPSPEQVSVLRSLANTLYAAEKKREKR